MNRMKNRVVLSFLAITSTLLISCNDDDKKSLSLIGRWETTTEVVTNCADEANNHTLTCGEYEFCQTFEFKSDETYTRSNPKTGYQFAQGTYKISDPYVLIDYGVYGLFAYKIQLNGSTLVLTESDSKAPCEIAVTYKKVDQVVALLRADHTSGANVELKLNRYVQYKNKCTVTLFLCLSGERECAEELLQGYPKVCRWIRKIRTDQDALRCFR